MQGLIVGSRREQQGFVRALDASGIRPVIDRRFPLEQLADAFRLQMSGGHFGKIGIDGAIKGRTSAYSSTDLSEMSWSVRPGQDLPPLRSG